MGGIAPRLSGGRSVADETIRSKQSNKQWSE